MCVCHAMGLVAQQPALLLMQDDQMHVSGRGPRSYLPSWVIHSVSKASHAGVKRPGRRSREHGMTVAVFSQIPTAAATHEWDRCCCCCARTPAVERARLAILRRSPVRPRHWANRPPRHQNSEHIHFTCNLGRRICVLEACLPGNSIILSHGETMAAAETLALIPPSSVSLSAFLSAMRLHHVDLCRVLQIHLGNVVPFQSLLLAALKVRCISK